MDTADITDEADEAATTAISNQRNVDRLLRQQSKDEWFARAALAAAAPYLTADAAQAEGGWDLPADLVEMAWVIIANANGGNWAQADPEWKAAAERWRDAYHDWLARRFAQDGAGDG